MKLKRVATLLLAAVLFSGGLTACRKPADNGTTESGTENGNGRNDTPNRISGVQYCTAPSTVRVLLTEKFSSDSQTLTFKAFRNEYESAQLILSAERNVLDYNVTLNDLTCGDAVLSREQFSVCHEKYIAVSEVYDSLSGCEAGMYPDALLPLDTAAEYGENQIRKETNQGIWFTVLIPKEQPAGVYRGNFTLTVDRESVDVPVEVTVWNFTVSDETHQKSCYAVYYDALGMGELSNTNEMETLYTEALLRYRLNPQSLPVGLGHDFDPSGDDLRNWLNATVRYTQDVRCTWINIPYKRVSGTLPSGKQSTSLVDMDLYQDTLKMLLERSLKENVNLMEKLGMWVTCLDEADYRNKPEDAAYVTEQLHKAQEALYQTYKKQVDESGTLWMGFVHSCKKDFILEVLEDMRTVQHFVTLAYGNDSRFNFDHPFTRCVQLGELQTAEQRAFYEAERARYNAYYNTDSGELWTYTGCLPRSPYPTLHIDDDLLTLRSFGWFMKQYHIIGQQMWYTNLYYRMENGDDGVMSELQDCYGTAERFPTSNGDGFLFYPGAPYGIEGPVGSIRLEVLRDSMEDYEVLYLMESMLREQVEKSGGVYTDAAFDSLMELLTLGYYDGLQVQIGDSLANGFPVLRESMVSVLELLEMGVTVTDVEKKAALVTVGLKTPANVTLSADGKALKGTGNGQLLLPADLTVSETVTLSATDGERTVDGIFWLGARQKAVSADGIADRIAISAPNSGSYTAHDAACGRAAYRLRIAGGRQETVLNLADLDVDRISQSLWIVIHNDSDRVVTAALYAQNAGKKYAQFYDRASNLPSMPAVRLMLQPGINYVELSGYGLVSDRGKLENLKLVWNNHTATEICILSVSAERKELE